MPPSVFAFCERDDRGGIGGFTVDVERQVRIEHAPDSCKVCTPEATSEHAAQLSRSDPHARPCASRIASSNVRLASSSRRALSARPASTAACMRSDFALREEILRAPARSASGDGHRHLSPRPACASSDEMEPRDSRIRDLTGSSSTVARTTDLEQLVPLLVHLATPRCMPTGDRSSELLRRFFGSLYFGWRGSSTMFLREVDRVGARARRMP